MGEGDCNVYFFIFLFSGLYVIFSCLRQGDLNVCYYRLVREAGEWGKSYQFYSCSDVDIVSNKDFR